MILPTVSLNSILQPLKALDAKLFSSLEWVAVARADRSLRARRDGCQ